jgi:hypothetical protein
MFSGKCSLRKLVLSCIGFLTSSISRSTFQILFYALRPTFVRSQRLTRWHLLNIVAQAIFDYILVMFYGSRPLIYLITSSFFAGSLHPCAGHFIAEHYLWDGMDQETFSYYGWLNILAYNVRFLDGSSDQGLTTYVSRLDTTMNITISLRFLGHGCPHSMHCHRSFTIPFLHIPRGRWLSSISFEITR